VEVVNDHGKKKTLHTDERYYARCEISWHLEQLGFREVDIHGCRTGVFSRSRQSIGSSAMRLITRNSTVIS